MLQVHDTDAMQAAREDALKAANEFGGDWQTAIIDGEPHAVIFTDAGIHVAVNLGDDTFAFYTLDTDDHETVELIH
ncbi:hypothetical protein CCP4SC76_5750004 [Gammaproteobacteria bacterium]